jgi:molecular chaperone DnaK (HSP70)
MVEVVGSGSRVPAINKILTEFFKKEPRRTMNASECVAKGAALQCAILSPTFKVREFQVKLLIIKLRVPLGIILFSIFYTVLITYLLYIPLFRPL